MARPGQRKPVVGERLSDHISLGVLTKTFRADVVDRVIDETGRREQRVRLLPARVVVYFTLAMCLFSRESYNEVMTLLTKGLQWSTQWSPSWKAPTDTAIALARRRLGPEPMKLLFKSVVEPIATKKTQGAWYRKWRLVAIDGTILDVADTPDNDKYFGRPGSKGDDRAAFPQARVMGLIDCGTHAIFNAVIGPCGDSENTLTPGLFSSIKAG